MKKSKKTHQKKKVNSGVSSDWLYLAPEGAAPRQLYELFREGTPWTAELWEEAGVLEIRIRDAGSVDMEYMEAEPEDTELLACMQEHDAQKVYAVTIMPEYYEHAAEVFRYLMGHAGGFFCEEKEL